MQLTHLPINKTKSAVDLNIFGLALRIPLVTFEICVSVNKTISLIHSCKSYMYVSCSAQSSDNGAVDAWLMTHWVYLDV